MGARTLLDDYAAMNAIAGSVIAIDSLIITVINNNWKILRRDEYVPKFKKHFNEPSALHLCSELMRYDTAFVDIKLSAVLGLLLQSAALFSSQYSSIHSGFGEGERLCVKEFRLVKMASCHSVEPMPFSKGRILQELAQLPLEASAAVGYTFAFAMQCCLLGQFVIFCFVAIANIYRPSWIPSKFAIKRFIKDQSKYFSKMYLLLCWSLVSLTIWDLTDHRDWEQWMWQDPWAGRLWIF